MVIDESLFRQEWERGATIKSMCAKLDMTESRIHHHRRCLGLPTRKKDRSHFTQLVGFLVTPEQHTHIDKVAVEAGLLKADWLRKVVLEKLK